MSAEATERRLERARRTFGAPTTPLAPLAVGLGALAMLAPSLARATVGAWDALLASALEAAAAPRPEAPAGAALRAAIDRAAVVVLPAVTVLAASALATTLAQTGGLVVSWRARRARFSGARDERSLVDLVGGAWASLRAAIVLVTLSAATTRVLVSAMPAFASTLARDAAPSAVVALTARNALVAGALTLALVAALDLVVARLRFHAQHRLDPRDAVRLEREARLSPRAREALGRARRAHSPWAASALVLVVHDAASATVLTFDPDRDHAPVVRARQVGPGGSLLTTTHEQRGARVLDDADLAEQIAAVAIGDVVPEESFEALARAFRSVRDASAA